MINFWTSKTLFKCFSNYKNDRKFRNFFFNAISVFADWYFICCNENNIINIFNQFIKFKTNFRQPIWSFIINFIDNDDIFNSLISIINSANDVLFNQKFCIFVRNALSYMFISKILFQCDILQCFIFSSDDDDSIFSDVIIKIDDHDVIFKNFIFVIDWFNNIFWAVLRISSIFFQLFNLIKIFFSHFEILFKVFFNNLDHFFKLFSAF